MKQNWEVKKLGEVCELSAGGDVPKDNFSEIKTDKYKIPIYANGEKNEGFYGFTNKAKVTKPSITVSARGTIGYAVKRLEPFFPIVRLIVVTPIDLKKLALNYLDYTLRKIDFKHSGSSIPQLTVPMIKDYEIPLPPLQEQQRIVAILDEAFSAIDKAKANTEHNLKNAKELFESELQSIFSKKSNGWEEKKLKDISNIFGRGKSKHRPRGDSSLLGGKYPLIQTGDISNSEHWINTYSQTYNEKGLAQSKLWQKGTICIAIVGSNVAETAILNFDACFPDSVIGIEVNPTKANNQYVDYLLQSFKTLLKEKGKGTARDNINLGTFENQKFPFPNIEYQQTIVSKLDALREQTKKLEAVYERKLQDLEELKKSVLSKAFSGEL